MPRQLSDVTRVRPLQPRRLLPPALLPPLPPLTAPAPGFHCHQTPAVNATKHKMYAHSNEAAPATAAAAAAEAAQAQE